MTYCNPKTLTFPSSQRNIFTFTYNVCLLTKVQFSSLEAITLRKDFKESLQHIFLQAEPIKKLVQCFRNYVSFNVQAFSEFLCPTLSDKMDHDGNYPSFPRALLPIIYSLVVDVKRRSTVSSSSKIAKIASKSSPYTKMSFMSSAISFVVCTFAIT